MLAYSNPCSVVVINSPSESTKKHKKFLGYEWSDSKGNEGIKYVDVEYVKNALRSKPHWIRVGKATLKLMINN